ncbi:MAG: sensor histidine kinase [Chloroflexota bacterium]
MVTLILLSPGRDDAVELAIYMVTSVAASLLVLELALRDRRLLTRFRLRPKLMLAFGVALVVVLANTLALAALMFVSMDHDLPLLIAIQVFSGALALLVAYRLAGHISHSLADLSNRARLVSSGDYATRLPVTSDDEVGDVSRSFNEMAASLEEAARRQVQLEEGRKALTAAVSHDLRTPLASARAMLEALADEVVTDPKEQQEYYRRTLNEVKELGALVDDLFQLSLLDVGALRLDVRPTPLQSLVLETVEGMQSAASRKGLNLESRVDDDMAPVSIDPLRMRRVLVNLVQNAIRHTPADGSVVVEAVDHGDSVRVEIRDSGEGISAEDVPRIWTRFFSSDPSRTRVGEGPARSGLGLAIAKAIVETHGGDISVSSRPGHGAVFRFTLPRGAAPPGGPSKATL